MPEVTPSADAETNRRARVGIPEPGDAAGGNAHVNLVKTNGRWKIACFGWRGANRRGSQQAPRAG